VPAAPTAAAPKSAGAPKICPSCGAANLSDAVFCSACGERLDAPAGTVAKKAAALKPARSRTLDYLMTFGAALAIAVVVMLIFTPEEHFGPAEASPDSTGAAEGMPPGHPPTEKAPEATPEQLQQIAALEAATREHPEDLDSKRKLADLYYNLERHAEAVPLYEAYLAKHPDDADARTDMAYSIANNGAIDSAIVELKRVVRQNAKHQNATYNLAMMYAAKRDRDSTLYWLERVVEIDSTTQPGQQAAQILAEVKQAHPSMGDSAMKRQ
jgi:tetratricopeptide (TPR) repeat protein